MTKLLQATLDRRRFLRRGAIGAAGIAAATIAACAPGAGAALRASMVVTALIVQA